MLRTLMVPRRLLRALVLLPLAAGLGCATTNEVNPLIKRAMFDLDCPREQLTWRKIDDQTFGVRGCGQKATYIGVPGFRVHLGPQRLSNLRDRVAQSGPTCHRPCTPCATFARGREPSISCFRALARRRNRVREMQRDLGGGRGP